jgi:hypothetical protein
MALAFLFSDHGPALCSGCLRSLRHADVGSSWVTHFNTSRHFIILINTLETPELLRYVLDCALEVRLL